MAVPDYQSLMDSALLGVATGELSVQTVIEQLGDERGLSESERSQLLAGGRKRTFDDRVRWAKSYPTQAGPVELPRRGHFRITELGRRVLSTTGAERRHLTVLFCHLVGSTELPARLDPENMGRW
jgi:restriction system protein